MLVIFLCWCFDVGAHFWMLVLIFRCWCSVLRYWCSVFWHQHDFTEELNVGDCNSMLVISVNLTPTFKIRHQHTYSAPMGIGLGYRVRVWG